MHWPLCLSLLLAFSFAHGSEVLDPIEVSAEKNVSDFYFGGAEGVSLEGGGTALLSEALEKVPGIVSGQNGGPGGRTSLFIRGTEARHVAFTVDKLKINDPSNTDRQFDAAFLTTSFLKEVRVYKGPQAVMFGSDALGGLVDMETRKGDSAPETRLSLNAGSFGTVDAGLSKDWRREGSSGTLSWASFRTDGISRLNEKRFSAQERDGARSIQLTSSSTHGWSPKWRTDLLASFIRGASELDGFTDDNSHDESKSDQYWIQQKTDHELGSGSSVSIRNGLSRHQRKLDTLAVGENSFSGDLLQHEVLFAHNGKGHELLAGIALEEERLNQDGQSELADLRSLFLQSSFHPKFLKLQLGLRSEVHSRYGDFHTGSAGVARKLGNGLLGLQWSRGFKAPSLYQLHGRPVFGSPIGNENLVPEKNSSLEANWVHGGETVSYEVALFRNDLKDLITYTNQGYRNQGRFVARGIELSLEATTEKFRLKPWVNYQEFKEASAPVLRRPNRSGGVHLSYFPTEELEFFSKLQAFDSRRDVDTNGKTVKLNGFETLGMGALLRRGRQEFGLKVENLMDRKYEEVYGYSVMPRSYFFHYVLRL